MSILETCKKARAASVELAKLSSDVKDKALCRMANALEANATGYSPPTRKTLKRRKPEA